jgi:hypothetical protein
MKITVFVDADRLSSAEMFQVVQEGNSSRLSVTLPEIVRE